MKLIRRSKIHFKKTFNEDIVLDIDFHENTYICRFILLLQRRKKLSCGKLRYHRSESR